MLLETGLTGLEKLPPTVMDKYIRMTELFTTEPWGCRLWLSVSASSVVWSRQMVALLVAAVSSGEVR